MLVAVALGLLGPVALAEENEDGTRKEDHRSLTDTDVHKALESDSGPTWARLEIQEAVAPLSSWDD